MDNHLQTLIEIIQTKYNQKIMEHYNRICLLESWGYKFETDLEIRKLYSCIEKLEIQQEKELKPIFDFMVNVSTLKGVKEGSLNHFQTN